jgi:cell division protein ZapA
MKSLEVQIMGQSYLLNMAEPSHATMVTAAARVDQAMCRIRDAGKTKAKDRIAVLAALNLAFEMQSMVERGHQAVATGTPREAETTATYGLAPSDQAEQLLNKLNAALGNDGQLI